jgi:hypothetical protein
VCLLSLAESFRTPADLLTPTRLVKNFGFPGSYSTALLFAPYSNCEPLIHECVYHPNDTGKPANYNFFDFLALPAAAPEKKA